MKWRPPWFTLPSRQRVSKLHGLCFIQNFLTPNYPYELKKRSTSVFIIYGQKHKAFFQVSTIKI